MKPHLIATSVLVALAACTHASTTTPPEDPTHTGLTVAEPNTNDPLPNSTENAETLAAGTTTTTTSGQTSVQTSGAQTGSKPMMPNTNANDSNESTGSNGASPAPRVTPPFNAEKEPTVPRPITTGDPCGACRYP